MNDTVQKTDALRAFLAAYRAAEHASADGAAPDGPPGGASGLVSPQTPAENQVRPFPGLRSFEATDSDVFFGRQEQTDMLLDLLGRQQVIAVLGGSGSGKSSVVRAGVIPALTSTFKIEGRLGRWYVAVCKPGQRPVDELCDALWQQICCERVLNHPNGGAALAAALGITGDLRDRLTKEEAVSEADKEKLREAFDRELRQDNRLQLEGVLWFASDVLDRLDRELNPTLRSGTPSVMVVVDQFEELFGTDVVPEQRDDLLALLKRVFDGSKDKTADGLYVTVTMRSEQLHRCAEYPNLSEVINGSMYLIELLDETGLREATIRPARRMFEKWGLPLDDGPTAPFDPKFVDWLLKESGKLRDSLVHKPDQLPLLQHALRLVWDNAVARWTRLQGPTAQGLTISFVDQPKSDPIPGVGFLRSCLNLAADKALADAVAVYRDDGRKMNAEWPLRTFFTALARRDDRGNWARRLVTWADLLKVLHDSPIRADGATPEPLDEPRFEKALQVFVVRGYLAPRHHESDGSRVSYEVCHEALIRHWRRYENWLEEMDETARSLRRVAQNLLSIEVPDNPLRWPDLQPYGYSPRDWLEWCGAVRERRAAGVVSEFNRARISLIYGEGAKFGKQWALDQLSAFLKGRDIHRGNEADSEATYAAQARGLLTGIENATALVPPRLTWSGTLAGLPRFVLDLVRHPDTRPFSLSGVVICFVVMLALIGFQQMQLTRQLYVAEAELTKKVHQAELNAADEIRKAGEKAAEDKITRLAHIRQIFGAQAVDTLLADDQIELARLVALTALDESPDHPEHKLRQSLGAVSMAQGRGPLLFGTEASTTRIIAVAPNGGFIAGDLPPASQPERPPVHRIQLWDPSSGATLMSLTGVRSEIRSIAVSPDAKRIAAGSSDGEISVWNLSNLNNVENSESSKPVKQFGNSASSVTALAFSQDGSKLISGGADKNVSLWNVAMGAPVRTMTFDASCPVREALDRTETLTGPAAAPPTDGALVAVALNSREDRLLAGTSDRRLILWDAATGACLINYTASGNPKAIAFGSNPVRAVLAIDRGVFVTPASDADKFELAPLLFVRNDDVVRSIGFDTATKQFSFVSTNGVTIATERDATTSTAGQVSAANKSNMAPRLSDEFQSVRFVPKTGVGVVAADNAGRVLIVQADKDPKRPLQIVQRKFQSQGDDSFSGNANAETVSDDIQYVAVASDGAVTVRHLDGDRKEYTFDIDSEASVRSLGIDATNKRLAIGFDTGSLQLWSFETEKRPQDRRLRGHSGAVTGIAFDRNGERMVTTASDDRRAIVWNLKDDGGRFPRFLLHAGPVRDAKFAADDVGVVTLSRDGTLRRFDATGSRSVIISPGVSDSNDAVGIALDRSRTRALVLDRKNSVEIWNLGAGKAEGKLQLPDVSAVGFWGETGEILTVLPSGELAIWSRDAGRLRAYGNLSSVVGGWNAVNPTRRNVLTFDGTRNIKLDPPPNEINESEVQAVVRAAVARTMTPAERQRYAPDKADASDPAPRLTQTGLRCDPNVEASKDAVTRDPGNAKTWFDLGCARENELRRSGRRSELPDPSLLVAAAMGHGPALASIGEWFASRKPRFAPLSSHFYRRAVLNDAGNGERYLDWLVGWGDHTRDAARKASDLIGQRANAGDPAAHFIRGMVAEGNAKANSGAPDQSDELLRALFHFALADKLFKQRNIDEPTTAIRLGALARVLPPERVARQLQEVAAWKAATASPAPPAAQTPASAGTTASEPAWRPDLTGIDVTKDDELHGLAVSAIDVLGRSLQLGPELDVLRAEYMLAQAKELGQRSDRAPVLFEAARVRFEAELNQDDTDTRSFDRVDEVLATLGKMKPDGSCDGFRAARAQWFERWPKPYHLVNQRRLAQIEAETSLGACFANAGDADTARKRLKKAADQVRETGELRNLPLEGRRKLAILEVQLADAYVQVGDRETAVRLYAHPLIESVRGPLGRFFSSNDLLEMTRNQRKALAILTQGPITPGMISPFADLAEALRLVDQKSFFLEASQVQELYRGSIGILQQLVQAEPDNIDQQLALWSVYGMLGEVSDAEEAVRVNQQGIVLIKTLSERNPANVTLLRNLITSQTQLGDALRKKKDSAGAVQAYREAIGMARRLPVRASSAEPGFWSNLYLQTISEYQKMGDARSAIDITGEWIELLPSDALPRNQRCWYRAINGDLELALADCNEAIRLKPDYGHALDSRGFTYLKLGKFDLSIIDYDAALKIMPGTAESFYGRGLAKLKSGDAEGGSSDITEAKRRKNDIERIFERMGVK